MFAASRDPTRIDECLFASRSDHAKPTRSIVSLCGNTCTECGVAINTPVAQEGSSLITCPKCNTSTKLDVLTKQRGKNKKKPQETKIHAYFKKPRS